MLKAAEVVGRSLHHECTNYDYIFLWKVSFMFTQSLAIVWLVGPLQFFSPYVDLKMRYNIFLTMKACSLTKYASRLF